MKKRILACLVAAALCFGLVPAPFALAQEGAGNAGQIVDAGGSNPAEEGAWQVVSPGVDGLRISKTIEPTGIENYFDITLTAQTKRTTADQSISVVIVLDVSNTMNNLAGNATRIANAKAAANQFISQFCNHENMDADRQIGVVAFNTNAAWAVPMSKANSAADAASLQGEVNDIAASPNPANDANHVRFTNMEGGLELARQELAADDAVNKYVIMLTDGFPTTYTESYDAASAFISGYDPYTPQATSSVPGEFYDEVADAPCSYGTSYSDRAAIRAREAASAMKSEGINIFAVGMSIGDQTIERYREISDEMAQGSDPASVMDCTGPNYEIGQGGSDAYRNWLGNAIAGGPMLGQANHIRYSDGDDLVQLESAYESFLHEIELTQNQPFTMLLTSDPMGRDIEFLHFLAKDGSSANALSGTHEEGAENTASYNADEKTIEWSHLQSGFERIQESEGVEVFTYELTYRVRVANEAEGFLFSEALSTNGSAYLGFATETNPEVERLPYPVPSVEAYEGVLAFTKLTDAATPGDGFDDAGLAGAEFSLAHSETCSACAAAREEGLIGENVVIAPMTAVSAEDGTVRFAAIPSGHDYVLSEAAAPGGYEPSARTNLVTVTYGETAIEQGEDGLLTWENGAYVARNAQTPIEPSPEPEPEPEPGPEPETPEEPEAPDASVPGDGSDGKTTASATPPVQQPADGATFAATNDPVNFVLVAAFAVIAAGVVATALTGKRRR